MGAPRPLATSVARPIPRRGKLAVLLRSAMIQGSWNYRTMLGGGFAYCMLPVLRFRHQEDPEALARAVERHAEHFNAHPYLAAIALGAVVRMEEDGEAPDDIRRFKLAVRGPLGSLGDQLVWVGWLPVTLLIGLVLAFTGFGPALTVATFLVLYNVGHLLLRVGGFRLGLVKGRAVAEGIRAANPGRQIVRITRVGLLLLGVVVGLLVSGGAVLERPQGGWLLAAALTFMLGYGFGQRSRRAETYLFMLTVSALFLIGMTL